MLIGTDSQINTCQHCILSSVCLGKDVQQATGSTINSHRIYHRLESLYTMGDQFEALYILRSGSAKSLLSSVNGEEQITAFHHPGDLLGVDGFNSMRYEQSLRFLETSSVCRIGLPDFNRAMAESETMRQHLLQTMSHAIVDEQKMLLCASKLNAEQRFAKFLLDLSTRSKQRGLSADILYLSMTRIDIANFLGMAIETVSRLLCKMQTQGILAVKRRQITVLKEGALRNCLLDNEENKDYMSQFSYNKKIPSSDIGINQFGHAFC